jgi:hypothetical protein
MATTMKRINLHVSIEARRHLDLYCFATGQEPGRVLEELILTRLPSWMMIREDTGVESTASGGEGGGSDSSAGTG